MALLRDAGLPALSDQELQEHQIARLYFGAFGRTADSAGLILQLNALRASSGGLASVGAGLASSAEFAARYGTLSDADFVRTVYQNDALYANALHRPADAAGEALYVQALGSGRLSRAALLVAFSECQEHVDLVAQRAGARDAAGFNLDLSPHLGIIPVISGPVAA